MYLINKDETEHTGQVGITVHRPPYFVILPPFLFTLSAFSVPVGILCVENVPGAMLGLLPSWRLFQKAIRGSARWLILRCRCTSTCVSVLGNTEGEQM